MHSRKFQSSLLLITGSILAAGMAFGQQGKNAKTAPKSTADWTTYGLNSHETRYSPLDQINAGNVSRLGLAWSYDIGTGGGNQEATPLDLRTERSTASPTGAWSTPWTPAPARKNGAGTRKSTRPPYARSSAAEWSAAVSPFTRERSLPRCSMADSSRSNGNRQARLGIPRGLFAG